MNNFTEILLEAKSDINNSLTKDELKYYIDKTSKILPVVVKDVLYIIYKYNILDGDVLKNIIDSNKSGLKNIANKLSIPEESIEDLWKILKDLKSNIKLLPHFMTSQERDSLIMSKVKIDDIVIDLSTASGRNDVIKKYMPIAHKIVNQYVGKSKLSRNELMSAAMMAFVNAMNDWDRSKGQLFKTYLSYRIQQQILNDIDKFGHTLSSTNWYATKKYGNLLNAISIDGMSRDEDGELKQDRLASLGIEDEEPIDRDEEKQWKQIFSILERKFKQRDIDIFYRYFGLAGYKREKSKDIAKSYGMSEGNIRNSVINKILAFLRTDKNALELLSNLQSLYNESIMIELIGCDKNVILEYLSNDDVFILLEELNKWNNEDIFIRSLNNSLKDLKNNDKIIKLLSADFEYLDNNFKKYKKDIILFLSNMYPVENMNKKSDVSLLEYMEELQIFYKKYN